MNSRLAPTLFSILSAALVTMTMLAGIDRLATGQPAAAQLAQQAVASASA